MHGSEWCTSPRLELTGSIGSALGMSACSGVSCCHEQHARRASRATVPVLDSQEPDMTAKGGSLPERLTHAFMTPLLSGQQTQGVGRQHCCLAACMPSQHSAMRTEHSSGGHMLSADEHPQLQPRRADATPTSARSSAGCSSSSSWGEWRETGRRAAGPRRLNGTCTSATANQDS